jgi:hypothetical protein
MPNPPRRKQAGRVGTRSSTGSSAGAGPAERGLSRSVSELLSEGQGISWGVDVCFLMEKPQGHKGHRGALRC